MMGHNGYDDYDEDRYDAFCYDEDLWNTDDSVDNICAIQEAFGKQNSVKTTDYARTEAAAAALLSQPITELPSGTKVIKTTPKAILFLLPSKQKFWVPKAGIKQYSPCFCISTRYFVAPDDPNAQYANPIQLNHAQPRCPYCGERSCDCGSTV